MKSTAKHNKIRNTGILFELLVRRITTDALNNKDSAIAVRLMREYFNSKKELGKELILYRSFFRSNNLSEIKAFEMIHILLEQRSKLNKDLLNKQKYNLIREIKENYDLKEFLGDRVPSYKIYASIYKLFESSGPEDEIYDLDGVISSKFTLVEHLCGTITNKEVKKDLALFEAIKGQDEDIRLLSYKILIEKFNTKYNALNTRQKNLLREYIHNVSNSSDLKKYILEECDSLINEIQLRHGRVKDQVVRIKLTEVVSQLRDIKKANFIKENHLTAILIAMEISKELDSVKGAG